jgi:hypothetical protein
VVVTNVTRRREQLTGRADIDVAHPIECEVAA